LHHINCRQRPAGFVNSLRYLNKRNILKIFIEYNSNQIALEGVCFIYPDERILIQTFCNDTGRKYGLICLLLECFIREKIKRKLIIDFAGSSMPDVRCRNIGFGCNEINYLLYNRPIFYT